MVLTHSHITLLVISWLRAPIFFQHIVGESLLVDESPIKNCPTFESFSSFFFHVPDHSSHFRWHLGILRSQTMFAPFQPVGKKTYSPHVMPSQLDPRTTCCCRNICRKQGDQLITSHGFPKIFPLGDQLMIFIGFHWFPLDCPIENPPIFKR